MLARCARRQFTSAARLRDSPSKEPRETVTIRVPSRLSEQRRDLGPQRDLPLPDNLLRDIIRDFKPLEQNADPLVYRVPRVILKESDSHPRDREVSRVNIPKKVYEDIIKGRPKGRRWPHRILPTLVIGVILGLFIDTTYVNRDKKDAFVPFTLVKKESVSPTASIFYLKPKHASKRLEAYQEAWKKGIWNFQFKQPQIQVVRAYTPLPPPIGKRDEPEPQDQLRFLIRNESHGEVSGWLHRLPVGSEIEMRGANLEYEISPEIKNVIFLAGGTGIASALQAAHALLSRGDEPSVRSNGHKNNPHISILWANRSRNECIETRSGTPEANLISKELQQLCADHPGQVTVDCFFDSENIFIDKGAVSAALSKLGENSSAAPTETQVLVSGPEGFINYLTGPKEWRSGKQEQGTLGGVVAQAVQSVSRPVKVWKV